MTVGKQPIPNDRRTRQLFIDAAIKRALAQARDARRREDEASEMDVAVLDPTSSAPGQFGNVPSPRRPEDPAR